MPTTRTTPVGVPANRNYCHVATICYAPIRFADLHCVLYNCNMQRITDWYNTVVKNWKEASKDEAFKFYFALNFVISFGLYFATIHWVKTNSTRTGTVLDDPLYHLLAPRDFSLPIFILTYSPVVIFLVYIVQYPLLLHRAFNSFVAVFMIRAVFIHFVPLSPASGIIVLNDPITNALADESHVLNDLFFSGHIGDLTTLFLLSRNKTLRRLIFTCACTVAFLLVWQRVHYTIDVIAAPLFAYISYQLFVVRDIIWAPYLKKTSVETSQGMLASD